MFRLAPEDVPVVQKQIIAACRALGRPRTRASSVEIVRV